jgi:hypothetical protein
MPGLAGLRLADKHRSRIRIEVTGAKAAELAVSASGKERGPYQIPEGTLRGID